MDAGLFLLTFITLRAFYDLRLYGRDHRLIGQSAVNHDVVFLFDLLYLRSKAAGELLGEIQWQYEGVFFIGRSEHNVEKAVDDARMESAHKRLRRPLIEIEFCLHQAILPKTEPRSKLTFTQALLFMLASRINFVTRILRFKEVHQFVHIG